MFDVYTHECSEGKTVNLLSTGNILTLFVVSVSCQFSYKPRDDNFTFFFWFFCLYDSAINISPIHAFMFKAKLCPVKLSPPGQYFMIVLSWNFVLSMIFGPLSGQYYQYNVMLWTSPIL